MTVYDTVQPYTTVTQRGRLEIQIIIIAAASAGQSFDRRETGIGTPRSCIFKCKHSRTVSYTPGRQFRDGRRQIDGINEIRRFVSIFVYSTCLLLQRRGATCLRS